MNTDKNTTKLSGKLIVDGKPKKCSRCGKDKGWIKTPSSLIHIYCGKVQ
jgi:hypothetical protein